MTASRETDDAVSLRQQRRDVIKDMRRITPAVHEKQSPAGSAPIEHLQLYGRL